MKYLIIGIVCIYSIQSKAQMLPSSFSKEETTYLFRVKIIEDFIDRFNDDSTSGLRQSFTELGLSQDLNRTNSFKTIFNQENKLLTKDTTTLQFVKYALDPENNCYLHFNDSNWYCKARCHFDYLGKSIELPIILTIRDFGEKGMKWMIVSIDDHYIFRGTNEDSIIKSKRPIKKSINATSYAVNFLDLNRVFNANLNETLCFEEEVINTEKGKKFINYIKSQQLKFEYANNLTFYFFQIPNFVLEVDEFNRNTNNSGWLINKVYKTNKKSKHELLKKLIKRDEN